ncbi:MAG: VCBS repeat-containing protein, partial [Nitrospira sp.]|nr:VCBS repeat-containing protein [Nitrospira sp.]
MPASICDAHRDGKVRRQVATRENAVLSRIAGEWRVEGLEPIPGAMKSSFFQRPTSARVFTAVSARLRPQIGEILSGLLVPSLLLFEAAAPSADLFVKVDNPGWPATTPVAMLPIWGDYDGDGWIDLFVGTPPAGQNRVSNQLYRNNQDGTFTKKLASEVGPILDDSPLADVSPGMRFWVDVNNDDFVDLLLLPSSPTEDGLLAISGRLYLNNGKGRFSSVEAGALTQPRLGFSANLGCVADYDNDGWLDVFL